MSNCVSFQDQLASILEVLAKTALAEITKLVDDGSAALRLEMCKSQRENEALKRKLLLMEGELRTVRGCGEEIRDNSLNISFEVQVCDEFRETQRQNANCLTSEKVTRGRFESCGSVSMKMEDARLQSTPIKHEPVDGEQDWSECLLLGEDGLEQDPKSSQLHADHNINGENTCGTSRAAAVAAGSGEVPLYEKEEFLMQHWPAGDPEKGLQVELKQDPEAWPLTPPPNRMKVQCVWSEAGSLGTRGQCAGKDKQRDVQVNLDCHEELLSPSPGQKIRLSSKEKMARYRARINNDPVARAEKLAKRREWYQMRKAKGFLDHVRISALSTEEVEKRRSQWRLAQKRRRERNKRVMEAMNLTPMSMETSGESTDGGT